MQSVKCTRLCLVQLPFPHANYTCLPVHLGSSFKLIPLLHQSSRIFHCKWPLKWENLHLPTLFLGCSILFSLLRTFSPSLVTRPSVRQHNMDAHDGPSLYVPLQMQYEQYAETAFWWYYRWRKADNPLQKNPQSLCCLPTLLLVSTEHF